MPRAVLFDLYNTLVPGGTDTMRHETARLMGADLGIDPDTYADLYQRTYPERFVGAFGDLEATVRTLAAMAGGSPTPSGVRLAATRRMTMIRSLLWPSAATLATLDALRANGWRLGLVSNCTAETPESLFFARADSETLRRTIETLALPFREVLVLSDIENMSYREIAETLSIPIGTVTSRLIRARQKVRNALRGER